MRAVFITEGGKDKGFGHITRCLAISQAFIEKKIPTFFIIDGDKSLKDLLKNINYKIVRWQKKNKTIISIIK